jgi:N6-adenosine-specific RNA methylase IME4
VKELAVAVAVEPRDLSILVQGRRLIAKAKTLDEVRLIRDQAEAIRCYLRMREEGLEAQNDAAEIVLMAERRGGEMLKVKPKNPGTRGTGSVKVRSRNGIALPETYEQQGLSPKDAERWQAIASIPPEDFAAHVASTKRANARLTRAGAVRLARHLKTRRDAGSFEPRGAGIVGSLRQIIDRGERFATVYADPPWRYGNQGTRAATDDHYITMTPDEICAEPVADIVEDNAHLHLWTTNAFHEAAFDVIRAWGFTYKSCFVWIKPQMGIGNYWRVSHEFLLFAVRGKAPFLVHDEPSWGEFDRGEHSSKPAEMIGKIERVSRGPYLEMYGRRPPAKPGWTVYGNQVEAG